MTIIVPNGYNGEINLVLSNVDDNVLTVDSNGIGYINKWTFNKTYSRPKVKQLDGENLDNNLVGFNPSTFWAKKQISSSENNFKIETLSFQIVTNDRLEEKQYSRTDLSNLVDKTKLTKSN